jgi:hypothetical protein
VSPDDGSEAADTVNLWGHCSGSDGANKPVFHHPGVKERPDEFERRCHVWMSPADEGLFSALH